MRRAQTDGGIIEPDSGDPTPVIDPRVAFIISDIISDPEARIPQFGSRSILRTPYWTAVKTGTSKGFRDNWTVGYSDHHTVGVWVGDPAGRPMRKISGVEGAGVIWRRIMNEVSGYRSRAPDPPAGLTRVRVCGLSGKRMGPECPGGREEWFVEGTEPVQSCDFHRRVRIDPHNDLIVPDSCVLAGAREEVVTLYPSPFDGWAQDNERGRALRYTDRCPPPSAVDATVTLLSPAPTEAVRIDPDTPRPRQSLPLHAVVEGAEGQRVTFLLDDVPFLTVEPPHRVHWPVRLGLHRVQARLEPEGPVSAVHLVEVY